MSRPRFNLRLLLGLTAIAAVLAWQYSLVRRREKAIGETRTTLMREVKDENWMQKIGVKPELSPSLVRRLMGDDAYAVISVQPSTDDRELNRLEGLFPEAVVARATFSW